MKNLRLYAIAAVVILILGLSTWGYFEHKGRLREKADRERLQLNQEQLMTENIQISNLVIKNKEVTGRLKQERDSLAAVLKIKPKQIERIIYINNTIHDTVNKPVPVFITGKDTWLISDSSKCYKWDADVYLMNDSLKVWRTNFEYSNLTTQTFYKKAPHIWFIRIGKWNYMQKINSECGEVIYKNFVFEK
jgi:hypothetical protein